MKDSNIGRVFYRKVLSKNLYAKVAFVNDDETGTYYMELLTGFDIFEGDPIDKSYWQETYPETADVLELGKSYVNWDLSFGKEAKSIKDTPLARKMYKNNILLENNGYLVIKENDERR